MMPDDTVTADLTVANNGTAQLRYAMTSASTNADGKGLRSQLTLTIEEGTCASPGASVYSGALNGGGLRQRRHRRRHRRPRPGRGSTSENFCFTVHLPDTTGNAFQGATTSTTFTFAAEQTANT